MMAYRCYVHTVTKYCPFCLLFDGSCPLHVDCIYETLQSLVFVSPNDYVRNLKKSCSFATDCCNQIWRLSKRGRKPTTIG